MELEKKKIGKWWEDGSLIIYPDVLLMRAWTILKTWVYMASLFIVMYYAAVNLDTIKLNYGTKSQSTWEKLIDIVQFFDIIITFFTAVKVR